MIVATRSLITNLVNRVLGCKGKTQKDCQVTGVANGPRFMETGKGRILRSVVRSLSQLCSCFGGVLAWPRIDDSDPANTPLYTNAKLSAFDISVATFSLSKWHKLFLWMFPTYSSEEEGYVVMYKKVFGKVLIIGGELKNATTAIESLPIESMADQLEELETVQDRCYSYHCSNAELAKLERFLGASPAPELPMISRSAIGGYMGIPVILDESLPRKIGSHCVVAYMLNTNKTAVLFTDNHEEIHTNEDPRKMSASEDKSASHNDHA